MYQNSSIPLRRRVGGVGRLGKRRKRNGISLGSNLLPIFDDGGQKKTKLGKRRHLFISLGKMVAIIAFIMVIVAKSIVKIVNKLYYPSSQTTQPSSIDSHASCQKLPHIHWINLDESKERRESFLKSAESLGIVNQHRVAAYDSEQVAALIDSKQVIFHPQIKVYAGDGQRSYLKHPDNIYVFNEAACLLSHLQAIKQAYDSGHELAFIAEDDASFSGIFCDEFHAYLALAPEGWKVLQFATNNPHVVQHGSFLSEPFISWQRYHHSTRAYLINRAGMETLLGKLHSTTWTGRSMWRVEEFPSVVADEAIYTLTGDTYYSTGLWVDTAALESTIQKKGNGPKGRWEHPYSFLEGKERDQINKKKEVTPDHFMGRSLLVIMSIGLTSESQIEKEIEVITQDTHALCKFHRVCEWEVNVIANEASLVTLFGEASSVLPPYVHIHTKVKQPTAVSNFLFAREILSTLPAKFDLVLFKDNDQRINGFPWRTFVEQSEMSVLSAPLRSTQRDHMLWSTKKKKSQDVQFHDANHWMFWWNGRYWHSQLIAIFENIAPISVPFLESYFLLMDAMFAKNLFDQVLTSDMYENPSSIPYVWCKAAYDWNSRRPSCKLIPLVSTHEDMNAKAIETRTNSNPSFYETSSVAAKWRTIVGGQHSILEMEKLCLQRLDIAFVDEDDDVAYIGIPDTDIIDCAEAFIQEYSPPLPPHESNALVAAENISLEQESKLEFVHITKTGGSSIENAGATIGINWGSCHYMKVEEVGCSSPDLPYEKPDYQSYALTSPWHTPPKLLKAYRNKVQYPYDGADLFTVVRNPYSRVLSEYYCPWNGFQPKFRRSLGHDMKDPHDPKVMNEWVKSMVGRLGKSLDEFNTRNHHKERVVRQAKGLNEDDMILAQKHYINQAEYVYDVDEKIVKHVLHYENLSKEFQALMEKYEIDATLPPKGQGIYSEENESRLSYKDLDPEAIQLINYFAKADFEEFGYQMVENKFQEDYSLEALA